MSSMVVGRLVGGVVVGGDRGWGCGGDVWVRLGFLR